MSSNRYGERVHTTRDNRCTIKVGEKANKSTTPFTSNIKLGSYPHIIRRLHCYVDSSQLIRNLYFLLYDTFPKDKEDNDSPIDLKKKILAFTGFDQHICIVQKIDLINQQLPKGSLGEIFYVLGCRGTYKKRLQLIERIVYFLASPYILQQNIFCMLPLSPIIPQPIKTLPQHFVSTDWTRYHYFLYMERHRFLVDDQLTDQEIEDRLAQEWLTYSSQQKEEWDERSNQISERLEEFCNQKEDADQSSPDTVTATFDRTISPITEEQNENLDDSEMEILCSKRKREKEESAINKPTTLPIAQPEVELNNEQPVIPDLDMIETEVESNDEEDIKPQNQDDFEVVKMNWKEMDMEAIKKWQDQMLTFVVDLDCDRRPHQRSSGNHRYHGDSPTKKKQRPDLTVVISPSSVSSPQNFGKFDQQRSFTTHKLQYNKIAATPNTEAPPNSLKHCLEVIKKGNEPHRRQLTTSVQPPTPQPFPFNDNLHKHLL